ncbi:MAG TPA: hypothetical protein VFC78_15790 [Tepidisphaeraceae bacterium]|nr:hypothetical protein [Tepidisphaeraceae bacterium]
MPRFPVSRQCPNCDSADSRRAPARSFRLSQCDRICTACGTRYTPQFPMALAVILMAIGALVSAAGAFLAAWMIYALVAYPGPGYVVGLTLGLSLCWLGYSNIAPIIRTLRPTASPRGFAVILQKSHLPAAPTSRQREVPGGSKDAAP